MRARAPGESARLLLDVLDVLGRKDFIVTKLYAGAPQDLSDAEVDAGRA